jgi:glycine reductase
MKNTVPAMAAILLKNLRSQELSQAERNALYKRGLIENTMREETAARRGVDMLLAKRRGESWQTEIPIPPSELAKPAPPAAGRPLKIALITDGGLMLKGNPERMPSGRCTRYYTLDLHGHDTLDTSWLDINHFGYDTRYVASDPHRLVPFDVLRAWEGEGEIEIHPVLYTLAGVSTAVDYAASFGKSIAKELNEAGVQAVILTST